MKNIIPLILIGSALALAGCERLSNGMIQDIEFPDHEPKLAVTMISRWDADTLVARTQSSAGILDTIGSEKQKNALMTLTHSNGASHTWGGVDDWEGGIGHVFLNPGSEWGTWTLDVECPGFESTRAEQTIPPLWDTIAGDYIMSYTKDIQDPTTEEFNFDGTPYYLIEQTIGIALDLPDRGDVSDQFLMRLQVMDQTNTQEKEVYALFNRDFNQDPRTSYLSIISGLLIQESTETLGMEFIDLEVRLEFFSETEDGLEDVSIQLEVAAVTPELAQFYTSIDAIRDPQGIGLFSEPLLAYSNMSSGYGCFGTYTSLGIPLK